MVEEVYYDIAFTLFPEIQAIFQEVDAPNKDEIITRVRNLRYFMISAEDRLSQSSLSREQREFQEVFRYGLTALRSGYQNDDWRKYVFFNEILGETLLLRDAFEWIVNRVSPATNPLISELDPLPPLLSSRIYKRVSGRVTYLNSEFIMSHQVLLEVQQEYLRRYFIRGGFTSSGKLEGERPDYLIAASLESWKKGWKKILDIADEVLKPGGTLVLVMPQNDREGLKTLFMSFELPGYPLAREMVEDLKTRRYTKIRSNIFGPFVGIIAVKR